MNPKFEETNIQEYKDCFLMWDRKGDSKVAQPHVALVMRSLMWNPTEKAVKKVLGDRDEYSRVSFEEFLPMLKDVVAEGKFGGEDDFIEGLKVFDKDNSGNVSSAEIRHVLSTLGERLEESEVDFVLKGMENQQGMINIDEIVKKIMENSLIF